MRLMCSTQRTILIKHRICYMRFYGKMFLEFLVWNCFRFSRSILDRDFNKNITRGTFNTDLQIPTYFNGNTTRQNSIQNYYRIHAQNIYGLIEFRNYLVTLRLYYRYIFVLSCACVIKYKNKSAYTKCDCFIIILVGFGLYLR